MALIEDGIKKRRVFDRLQTYAFHIVDLTPNVRPPFWTLGVFNGSGFTQCSSPEYTVEAEEVSQINSRFRTYVPKKLSCSPITLSRGVSPYDSTFYQWINRSRYGEDYVHRTLYLMHFMSLSSQTVNDLAENIHPTALGTVRMFGKGYALHNCIVTRYKAGTDFDATSDDISIAELEIQPEYFTEISLDPSQLTDLALGGEY